mgnify:CR=1 FL=1
MDFNIKPNITTRQDNSMPQTIEQVIKKYKLDSMWEEIQKIVNEVLQHADFIKAGLISGDRIKGGTLTLGGENNVNGELRILDKNGDGIAAISKDGLILENGTQLIGANGVLSNLQFGQYEWKKVGYSTDYLEMGMGEYLYVNIPIFIPSNFDIESAKITLYHSPVRWTYNTKVVWGYCRNLKLYIKEEDSSYYEPAQLNSEKFPENDLLTREITNAFGTNGFTALQPSDSSHTMESKVSIDIKDYLKINKNLILQIRSGNTIPKLDPDIPELGAAGLYQESYLNQTGNVKAVLDIVGKMK